MALNFPDSPTPNQVYAAGGVSWTWNGVAWLSSHPGVAARRHAWVSTGYGVDYCGYAPVGTADATAAWKITRITLSDTGSVTLATAINVAWTDYLTAVYT